MKYFFILGNNPTLSFAEIVSVFKLKLEQVLALSKETLIIELGREIDARQIIRRLGGTIKLGIINDELKMTNNELIPNDLILKLIDINNVAGKFNFGISYYGHAFANSASVATTAKGAASAGKQGKFKQEKEQAMKLKKALKEKGVGSRWVTSREKVLSSVVVEQNKLVGDRGMEIVIIGNNEKYFIGKTLAVQPFKELSARDYGRPGRDDYSGMLPPKLAQILINLSGAEFNNVLLDPFCGSGTIITEAALMGFQNLIGCDVSEKAVEDSKKNFQWIQKTYDLSLKSYDLKQCDVRQLSQKITRESVDAIVTEPYLGPSRMERNEKNIRQVAEELENLYRQAILEFARVLKSDGRVVMVWPVFRMSNNEIKLKADKILGNYFKIVNILAQFLSSDMIKLTERGTIVYGRENQRVWREIVVLELK